MTPAASTTTGISIFMDSRIIRVSPSTTLEPISDKYEFRMLNRVNSIGQPSRYIIEGVDTLGNPRLGIFPRPGRHTLEATDPDGQRAAIVIDVAAEAGHAAPALDLPDRE